MILTYVNLDLQKRSHSQSGSQPPFAGGPSLGSDLFRKWLEIREAIKAYWRCPEHSTKDRAVPCWTTNEGINANKCYVITEQDLNWWADEIVHILFILLYSDSYSLILAEESRREPG